ncbi:MAG: transposase, partial [Phycisphaerae bacterium]|nr:transposase [Phycisphaerae bacterium]
NDGVCFYMIDRSRGGPALAKFFITEFDGVLITDFWAAYNAVCAADRQCCLVHLLRELEKVDMHNESPEWQAFAKKLRRLIGDGIRLRKRADYTPQRYASRVGRVDKRLMAMARAKYADADASRLGKRLLRHADHLFTFLDYPEVPFENNFAERMIRPAVIIRKNSLSNRSENGAAAQSMLMSVYRTLKLRGHNPIATVANALRTYVQTGTLPPLPEAIVADG